MADWSLPSGNRQIISIGTNTANGKSIQVDAPASTHTKGSWAELAATTEYETSSITFFIQGYQTDISTDYLIDLAIGAAASEQVILENYHLSVVSVLYRATNPYTIPIKIPAGSRISCRIQSSYPSGLLFVGILLHSTTYNTTSTDKIYTFGADTSDSGGVSIDPGGSANTKGSWVELTAATEAPLKWLSLSLGSQLNSSRESFYGLLDIGIGAAASEQTIISDLPIACNSIGDKVSPGYVSPILIDIPEGSRIVVRAQVDIIEATDRLFDIILYGGA
jgi:hypothetical protein